MNLRLFHISENPSITVFEPRKAPDSRSNLGGKMVWAIDEEHVQNYLLPRDCPRVTFYADANSNPQDILTYLHPFRHVVVIERSWEQLLSEYPIYLYELPVDSFELQDANAGYYIAWCSVKPLSIRLITNCLNELIQRGVGLRVESSLWELHDNIIHSSLCFSMIRMRNALPR